MAKKKRSFGSVFLGFIRGLVTLLLVLVLIVSVGSNVIFYSADTTPKIDILNYHFTFFVNNSTDLKYIDEGSMVIVDHTHSLEENTYVLCTIGNGYKTVLCLASVTENENGTYSYNVRGDRMNTETVYSIPASKIHGTVLRKNDLAGDIVRFSHETRGIAALMAIPAFLLIILSIVSIRRKRARYDDDMLEAEIYIEELRKAKRSEEKKAEENRRLMAQKAAEEAEAVFAAQQAVFGQENAAVTEEPVPAVPESVPAADPEPAPVPVPASDPAPFAFEEYKRKPEAEPVPEVSEPAPVVPADTEPVSKYEFTNFQTEELQNIYNEQINSSAPVFQEIPETARPSYKYENPVQNFANLAEVKHNSNDYTEEPAPVQKPAPSPVQKAAAPAPVKKKAKPPVKKINADSIDDLIRILEEEKRKLD